MKSDHCIGRGWSVLWAKAQMSMGVLHFIPRPEGSVEKVVLECIMPKADPPLAEKLAFAIF